MRSARLRLPLVLACAAILPLSTGCGDDSSTGPQIPAALVGSWNATSFSALGVNLITGLGMTFGVTLTSGGTYTINIAGDNPSQPIFCENPPAASCVQTGDFTATSTQVTFDPGTVDEVIFSYTISGNTLTITGTIDGTPVTATFVKT